MGKASRTKQARRAASERGSGSPAPGGRGAAKPSNGAKRHSGARTIRLLDMGCHDLYLTAWLAKQLDGQADVVLDGVELGDETVERARERHEPLDADGRIEQGRAEDAPGFFEPGSYDAVVAYELLEHVPDVARLLDACEQMARPGGRVYLSTPDGTFGGGGNPNHLRTLTSQQLVELIRRRGDVQAFHVGDDGIAAVAYEPAAKKGAAVIHTGSAWERWSPWDIVKKGLGGSETAAVRLANALADEGYVPTVYGGVDTGQVARVMYRHETAWDPGAEAELFISSRIPEIADAQPRAKTRLLWLHDTDCGPRLTPERAEAFDRVLVLSEWHKQHVERLYPFLRGKVARIRNGIHADYYDPSMAWEDRDPLLLYTSSPDRGLDLLLKWWPDIRAACRKRGVKDPQFRFCYASVYDAVADQRPDVAEFRDELRRLEQAAGAGVERLPSQPQPELGKLMGRARAWAHPSWHTPGQSPEGYGVPFMETSCMGAMEAQASGLAVVVAARGALRETVKEGVAIGELDRPDEHPDVWRDEWVEAITAAICDRELGEAARTHGPKAMRRMDWRGVARQVAKLAT